MNKDEKEEDSEGEVKGTNVQEEMKCGVLIVIDIKCRATMKRCEVGSGW